MARTPAGLAVEVTDDGAGFHRSGHHGEWPGHHAGAGRGNRRHRHGPGRLTRRHGPGAAACRDYARAASRHPGGARVTRVLIVDDHPVFRDGLAGLLATLPGVEVTGTAGTAEQALAAIRESPPDVVLMDINLPGASGIEATRRASQIAPAAAVLVVTMVDDDDTVFAALAAGARGYVLKGASADEIAAALRTVTAGGAVFGAGVASLAPGPHARAVIRSGEPIQARRPDHAGTRGTRPAGRGHQQPADRPLPRYLPENRAKPRLPHPRQAPGRRPDPGRPPRQGHPTATTALSTPQTLPQLSADAAWMTPGRVAGRKQLPCLQSQWPLQTPTHRAQDAPNRQSVCRPPAYSARLVKANIRQGSARLSRGKLRASLTGVTSEIPERLWCWMTSAASACTEMIGTAGRPSPRSKRQSCDLGLWGKAAGAWLPFE